MSGRKHPPGQRDTPAGLDRPTGRRTPPGPEVPALLLPARGYLDPASTLRLQRLAGNQATVSSLAPPRALAPTRHRPTLDPQIRDEEGTNYTTIAAPVPAAKQRPLGSETGQVVLQRGFWDRVGRGIRGVGSAIAGGARRVGGAVVSGLSRLGSGAVAALRRAGSGVVELVEDLGEVAAEWGPRIVSIVTNPVGALAGGGWLTLPDRFKPRLIGVLLRVGDAILSRLRGLVSAVIGPLWPLVREFFLGFIRRMRATNDQLKIGLSNKLARILSGGSIEFMLGFAKGLALGVWDVIRSPYDLVVGIIDGVKFVARFLGSLTREDFAAGAELLSGGLRAAWSGMRRMVTSPRLALRFIETIWDSIKRAVGVMGHGLASALLRLFQLPDGRLGEESGKLTAGIAADVVLGVLTAGAAAALRRVAGLLGQLARFIRAGRGVTRILPYVRQVVAPILEGIGSLGRLFHGGAFGSWLTRLRGFLTRMQSAAERALTGATRAAGRGRQAVATAGRAVQRVVQRLRRLAGEIFGDFGFRRFDVEVRGGYVTLYGIHSKVRLFRFRLRSVHEYEHGPTLARALRQRRTQLLREARRATRYGARAQAQGRATLAERFWQKVRNIRGGRASRVSEEIGEVAGSAAVRRHVPGARQIFAGRHSGTLDRVFRAPDGSIIVLEAKGGSARPGWRSVRGGARAQQGTRAYLSDVLRAMERRARRDGDQGTLHVVREIREALRQGKCRYLVSQTPIGSGPLRTRLKEARL